MTQSTRGRYKVLRGHVCAWLVRRRYCKELEGTEAQSSFSIPKFHLSNLPFVVCSPASPSPSTHYPSHCPFLSTLLIPPYYSTCIFSSFVRPSTLRYTGPTDIHLLAEKGSPRRSTTNYSITQSSFIPNGSLDLCFRCCFRQQSEFP